MFQKLKFVTALSFVAKKYLDIRYNIFSNPQPTINSTTINSTTLDKRLTRIENWLRLDLAIELQSLRPASVDASFRRYFRATTVDTSYVVMDAPPDKENVTAFIAIAKELTRLGIHAPAIYAQNIEEGFLLLEDLGNRTYLDKLGNDSDTLYGDAVRVLIRLQERCDNSAMTLPIYSEELLHSEMLLFQDWFINKHLNIDIDVDSKAIWKATRDFLAAECTVQPQVRVHRDYHSRNLMITNTNSPGVIDFQDMVVGPIAYDLASIFKDCYIEWPRAQQLEWLAEYYSMTEHNTAIDNFEFEQLIRWYDMAGLQRHLKVLGIFCRLGYRDGKTNYLGDLPLVAKYILEVLELYPELTNFKQRFEQPIGSVL